MMISVRFPYLTQSVPQTMRETNRRMLCASAMQHLRVCSRLGSRLMGVPHGILVSLPLTHLQP